MGERIAPAQTPQEVGPSALQGESELEPLPLTAPTRSWHWWTMAFVWISSMFNPASLSVGGSLLALGFHASGITLALFLSGIITAVCLSLSAWPGVKYGIPFPVLARSAFGNNGAQVATVSRAVVAVLWFSWQLWQGVLALDAGFTTAAGRKSASINPDLSVSQLILLFLFAACHALFVYLGINRLRFYVYWLLPFQIALFLGILGWSVSLVPLSQTSVKPKAHRLNFLEFLAGMNAAISMWSTLILNVADLSRFVRLQKDQVIGQFVGVPLPFTFAGWVGIVAAGASFEVYGEAYWYVGQYLVHWSPGWAVAGGLVAAASVLSVNVFANLISAMNDLLNLAPHTFDLKVCGYVVVALGVIICPWWLFQGAGGFIFTFLAGYAIVIGALAGVVACDFWLLRRCRLDLTELYAEKDTRYPFGINLRAFFAIACGVLPLIPGFVISLMPSGIQVGENPLVNMYSLSFFSSYLLAGAGYWLISIVCPAASAHSVTASNRSITLSDSTKSHGGADIGHKLPDFGTDSSISLAS
eukprot:gb/GEZN01006389.1/.p1 GENE.gb/GEZN01006389.1/~~gb/GEZN01006389.1/.p1  ORF type:complete len:529 (-),score=38.96 gb/GEZN01006389.1/:71-1657(-)